jgi:hypothetical protein
MPKRSGRGCFLGFVFAMVAALGWSQITAGRHGLASDNIAPDRVKQYADVVMTVASQLRKPQPQICTDLRG